MSRMTARQQLHAKDEINVAFAAPPLINPPGLLPSVATLSPHELRRYSLAKLICDGAEKVANLTLEREISDGIAQDIGQVPLNGGIYVPVRLYPPSISQSGLDTRTNSAGNYLTGTRVADIADYFASRSVVLSMGATFLSRLAAGNLLVPTEESPTVASWVSENPASDIADSNPVFGSRLLSPKTMQASMTISKQLLRQANAEAWLRRKLAIAHAVALDGAAINGSGCEGQPTGILKVPNISIVALGANGAVPTLQNVLDLESAVADANADLVSCGFVTTVGIRKLFRAMAEVSGGATPLWKDSGVMLGWPAKASRSVPNSLTKGTSVNNCHAVIFGYWPALTIGDWGVIEVVVDPYQQKKQGMVELTSFQMVDVALQTPSAFGVIADAKTS